MADLGLVAKFSDKNLEASEPHFSSIVQTFDSGSNLYYSAIQICILTMNILKQLYKVTATKQATGMHTMNL